MLIECRTVPASKLRMPYIAYKAQYEAQYDDERGTEGDGYDSEEIDERYLQAALNRYKDYMKNKPIIRMYDESLLRENFWKISAMKLTFSLSETPIFVFFSAVHSCFCDMINTNKYKKIKYYLGFIICKFSLL
jgi:hypothetical protein